MSVLTDMLQKFNKERIINLTPDDIVMLKSGIVLAYVQLVELMNCFKSSGNSFILFNLELSQLFQIKFHPPKINSGGWVMQCKIKRAT